MCGKETFDQDEKDARWGGSLGPWAGPEGWRPSFAFPGTTVPGDRRQREPPPLWYTDSYQGTYDEHCTSTHLLALCAWGISEHMWNLDLIRFYREEREVHTQVPKGPWQRQHWQKQPLQATKPPRRHSASAWVRLGNISFSYYILFI